MSGRDCECLETEPEIEVRPQAIKNFHLYGEGRQRGRGKGRWLERKGSSWVSEIGYNSDMRAHPEGLLNKRVVPVWQVFFSNKQPIPGR